MHGGNDMGEVQEVDDIRENKGDIIASYDLSGGGTGSGLSWGNVDEKQSEDGFHDSDEEGAHESEAPDLEDDEDDDEIDQDAHAAHGVRLPSEKRKAQNQIFKAYAQKKLESTTEAQVKQVLQDAKDEYLSIRHILAKQENSHRITNTRDYQTELFQRAKQENIIAVLDTGSGKTHIATLLLQYILDVELENRSKNLPQKMAFFLVDSVNLVFQQANVLSIGLSGHGVEGVCGAMGAHLWDKKTWTRIFDNNKVVVCTAEVLVQCLMHSFTSMDLINLLIFDEAHHAKKNHSYARLVRDYYLQEKDMTKRPRIFGMTASPVNARVDVKQAAQELETLLHCNIATTSNQSLLTEHVHRPAEEISAYPRLKQPFETPFHRNLKDRYGDIIAFKKFFDTSKHMASELGAWASDVYWSFAFADEEGRKIEMREEQTFHKRYRDDKPLDELNQELARLKEAGEFVKQHHLPTPTLTLADVSTKVINLYTCLNGYYGAPNDHRCLVFVERRTTARLLNIMFSHFGIAYLKSDILVGSSSTFGDPNISLRKQVLTVSGFRSGSINCLFCTSVAEEGLDIPECNLVVRFDLYKTMIAYVQSRGRARHRNSKYVHFLEDGNGQHQLAFFEARSAEQKMRKFCEGLPIDRYLDDLDEDAENLLASGRGRVHNVESTGARLTYNVSLTILQGFVSTLPKQNAEVDLKPTYVVEPMGGKFVCEVILPACSPVVFAKGRVYKQKKIAKCSAAFEACLKLRECGYLDENLLSTYKKALPAMRNAILAISSKKKDLYRMRLKPDFWNIGFDTVPGKLYLTVVDVTKGLDRPHQPLGLLTRAPLPQMPEFPVYLKDGRSTDVVSTSLGTPITISAVEIEQLTGVTWQMFWHIFAKKYKREIQKFSYWIVPIHPERAALASGYGSNPGALIDWDQVSKIVAKENEEWTPDMPNESLSDRYLVDKWDGGRRFYSYGVTPDLKPQDPVPGSAPKHKFMKDILDYSVSLWNKGRANKTWVSDQPVIGVEKIPFRRNHLALVEKDEDEIRRASMKTFVCPEPLIISTLSTKFVAMCYIFPAIIHRFDDYLIAIDACNLLGLDISPALALEALTKDSDNSEEHGEEKINFKRGMGPNYERLEFMGDCFLKMATSIATFVQQPNENEFEFHVRRMLMLCNKNLFNAALEHDLTQYIRTMAFSRRTWYPEGMTLEWGKGVKQKGPHVIQHSLGDKSIADVCEAFIGAAFVQHNDISRWEPKNWDEAVKAVKVLVRKDDHLMEKWSDYYAAYEKPRYQIVDATASQLDLAEKVEKQHPYHFKYPRLLRSAFCHPSQSFMWEEVPNYQRLEFLGDSLLDQVFITYLFNRFPEKDPQWLTEHKMPMVSNKFLGAVCVQLGWHVYIRQNNAALSALIRDYVTEVQEAEREAKGSLDYWNTVSEPPKCLADMVEAYVGAMFVDSEFDFRVVQTFFDMHIKRYFADMTIYDSFANNHPTTRLTKLLNINFGCREWRIATSTIESAIPGDRPTVIAMVQIHWQVRFDGKAVSGRYARLKASNNALEGLEGLPKYEFKRIHGCDCKDETEIDEASLDPEKAEEMVKEQVGFLL